MDTDTRGMRETRCPHCDLQVAPGGKCERCGGTPGEPEDMCPMCGAHLMCGMCGWCRFKEETEGD